jgi:PqqA peptide cyclase
MIVDCHCHAGDGDGFTGPWDTTAPLDRYLVRARPLADIWRDSPALVAFRGEDWMPTPCRSCDERAIDFGGCRCQAFALAGDAAATDPACALAPGHDVVLAARMHAERPPAPAAPIRLRRFHPSRDSG